MVPKEVLDLVVVQNNAYPSQKLSGTPKKNLIIAGRAIYLKQDIQKTNNGFIFRFELLSSLK
jgi:hypothetical protein